MTARLHLLCVASTPSARSAAFPGDEKLDAHGRNAMTRLLGRVPSCAKILRSPARSAAETAESLGLDAEVEPLLRECDFGRWVGRSFEDVQSRDPDAIADWLLNPDAAPHQGESFSKVMTRVAGWMDGLIAASGSILAITHPTIIRAAIACALGAGPQSFRHIDVAPLTRAKISGHGGRWTLAALTPLKEAE